MPNKSGRTSFFQNKANELTPYRNALHFMKVNFYLNIFQDGLTLGVSSLALFWFCRRKKDVRPLLLGTGQQERFLKKFVFTWNWCSTILAWFFLPNKSGRTSIFLLQNQNKANELTPRVNPSCVNITIHSGPENFKKSRPKKLVKSNK